LCGETWSEGHKVPPLFMPAM